MLKIRARELQDKSPVEVVLWQLSDPDLWVFDYKSDSHGRLSHLFFAHLKTVRIFESHSDVIMADCTYRTNQFKMPLLHFVGSNSIGGHFRIAFCFMSSETQPDYLWALACLQTLLFSPIDNSPKVFLSDNEDALRSACAEVWPEVPRLLCLWHINKNVQDRLQKHFRRVNGPWDPTEAERAEQLKK